MDSNIKLLLLVATYAFMLFTIVRIIIDTNNSGKALGYLMMTILLPVLGSIIYFTLGVNYRHRKIFSKKLYGNQAMIRHVRELKEKESFTLAAEYPDRLGHQEDLFRLLLNDSKSYLTENHVSLLVNGEQKFPEVIRDLESATTFIHLEYYIYEDDEIGRKIRDIMIRKAREGVKVRFIFDDFGSKSLQHKFIQPLKDAGVEVYPFFKVYLVFAASRINYRNHRKMIIIDGRIGYLGGINISDRYINNKAGKLFWRDTSIRMEGPVVHSLQYNFLADWNFCSKQDVNATVDLFPENRVQNGQSLVQIVASGPDYPNPSIMLGYFTAIVQAKQKVYLTTPYFIPSNSILDALKKAAFAGKEVRLLVPEEGDSAVVALAAQSYFSEMMEAGVHIHLYKKGFVHAKTMVVDENFSVVGTANMDFRSFELNFEMAAMIYGKPFCAALTNTFMEDLKDSTEIDPESWKERGQWTNFKERVCRLFSPLL
jgi:cardiolipin synthase A/B